MTLLLSLWTWFIFSLLTIVGFFCQCLLLLVTWPWDPHRFIAGRFFRLVSVTIIKCCPHWRFSVVAPYPPVLRQSYVVISNHRSHLDAMLISHLPWEMKWLGKEVLFKIPFLGWMMTLAGDVSVHRGEKTSARLALEKCSNYLSKGVSIFIFPEGTRSLEEEMLPFKDGAFRLACQNQVPILPLALIGTSSGLLKNSWRCRPTRAFIMVGDLIFPRGHSDADVLWLKDQSRQAIEMMVQRLHGILDTK